MSDVESCFSRVNTLTVTAVIIRASPVHLHLSDDEDDPQRRAAFLTAERFSTFQRLHLQCRFEHQAAFGTRPSVSPSLPGVLLSFLRFRFCNTDWIHNVSQIPFTSPQTVTSALKAAENEGMSRFSQWRRRTAFLFSSFNFFFFLYFLFFSSCFTYSLFTFSYPSLL